QYCEMEAFSQCAPGLDASTQRLLARGARLTEVLKQGQYAPRSVAEQVVAIFAGVRGYLDGIGVRDVTRFEEGLLGEFRSRHGALLARIDETGDLDDDTEKEVDAVTAAFAKTFA
ncbi:MAG: F0F1 ATP synthase subunit alpha, partial [Alphaproteobacteria bacterium]|nr:F0F1 ATP synthase subunit alpha [Alphaproteobacteria bacterium]